MAIENIEDYWRGEPDFGLRRRKWVIEFDCRGTDLDKTEIGKLLSKQRITLNPEPVDDKPFTEMCQMGLVPNATELLVFGMPLLIANIKILKQCSKDSIQL